MKVKRLMASIGATFEDFVAKVENHEAVADSVIVDVQRGVARQRVQLGRVRAGLERLQHERKTVAEQRERWRQRALRIADDDQDKALECVRRLQSTERRLEQLDAQLLEHQRLQEQLEGNLSEVERHLESLQLRRSALSSRAARVDALSTTVGTDVADGQDHVFERWESAVLAGEYRHQTGGPETWDALESDFLKEEEAATLVAALDQLRAEVDANRATRTDGPAAAAGDEQ